jgi:hypothetical protein
MFPLGGNLGELLPIALGRQPAVLPRECIEDDGAIQDVPPPAEGSGQDRHRDHQPA